MIGLFLTGAFICHALALLALWAAFTGRRESDRPALPLVYAGATLHAASIAAYALRFGSLPIVGLSPSLSTLAFITTIFILLCVALSGSRAVALAVLPFVCALLLPALLPNAEPAGEAVLWRGAWFAVHVLLAFIAYGAFAVSAGAGLLYLLQFRELKDRRLGRIFRYLPALPALDRIGRAGLFAGFAALTIAIVIGWGWSEQFSTTRATERAQVIWSIVTWIVFALILLTRWTGMAGRERRAALASVVGFVIVLIAYVVLRTSTAATGGFL